MSEQTPGTSGLDQLASIDLNLLVPLLALLEERSVTRAATRVGLSQPAMSHALARMRRLLDDELLFRQSGQMALTPRAVDLIGPVRGVLEQVAHIVRFPGFDPGSDSRIITLAMTTSTAFVLGGPLSRLVAERAPHATLRIRTTTVPEQDVFTEEGVDVVLLSEAWDSPFPRERLFDDRWVVVSARGAAPVESDALDLLKGLPHVAFQGPAGRFPPYAVLDDRGVRYTVRQLVPDNMLLPSLVEQVRGVGLHFLSVATVMQDMFHLRVDEFPLPLPGPGLGIDMVWNPRIADQAFVTWLRGILLEATAEV